MKRTLRLNRDTLTELTTDELGGVVGADIDFTRVGNTCPLAGCAGKLTIAVHCGGWTFTTC